MGASAPLAHSGVRGSWLIAEDIPQEERDPWSEFGMDGATLEAKIAEMERENEAMERRLRGGEGVAV